MQRRCGFGCPAAGGAWVFQLALGLLVANAGRATAQPPALAAWQSQAAFEQAAVGQARTTSATAESDILRTNPRRLSSSVVLSISPTQVTARIATKITLHGAVEPGDKIAWVNTTTSCDSPGWVLDPADGVNKSTHFTFTTNGTYKLCLRVSGGTSFVEQPDVSLEVLEACIPEVVPTFTDTCKVPAGSVQECTDLARRHAVAAGDLGENLSAVENANGGTDDRPTGCFWQAREAGHTDAGLYFNPLKTNKSCTNEHRCLCCSATPTNSLAIAGVSQSEIVSGEAIDITLLGTIVPGDRVAWVPNGTNCSAASYDSYLEPAPGAENATRFTVDTVGIHQLCYWPAGSLEPALQDGVQLKVTSAPGLEECAPTLSSTYSKCTWPMKSAEHCDAMLKLHAQFNITRFDTQDVSDRPSGCWFQSGDNRVFFNNASSTVGCNETGRPCICCSATTTISTSTRTTSTLTSTSTSSVSTSSTSSLSKTTTTSSTSSSTSSTSNTTSTTATTTTTATATTSTVTTTGTTSTTSTPSTTSTASSITETTSTTTQSQSTTSTSTRTASATSTTSSTRTASSSTTTGTSTTSQSATSTSTTTASATTATTATISTASTTTRTVTMTASTTTTRTTSSETFTMSSTSTSTYTTVTVSTTSTRLVTSSTTATFTTTATNSRTTSATTSTSHTTVTATTSATTTATSATSTSTTATSATATSTTTSVSTTTSTTTRTTHTTTTTNTTATTTTATITSSTTGRRTTTITTSTTQTRRRPTTTSTSTSTHTHAGRRDTHTSTTTLSTTDAGSDTTVTASSVSSSSSTGRTTSSPASDAGTSAVPTDTTTLSTTSSTTSNETALHELECGNFSCPMGYAPKLVPGTDYCSADCTQECCEIAGAVYLVLGHAVVGRRLDDTREPLWFYLQPNFSTPDRSRSPAQPGSEIRGQDRGDGWLQVGTHLLPFIIDGVEVLVPQVVAFSNGSLYAPLPLWVGGIWGACVPACGPGRQSRLVLCPERYSQFLCEWSGERPPEQIDCMNAMPCPLPFPDENANKAVIHIWATVIGALGVLCICPFLCFWFCCFWPSVKRAVATAKDRSKVSMSEVQKHWDLEAVASTQGVPVFDFEERSDSTKSSSCATITDIRGSSDITFAPGAKGESSLEDESPMSSSQQCHSGHTITKLQVPWTGDFSCDACGRELEEGTHVWSCAECRRDLCNWCMPEWREEMAVPLRIETLPILCPLGHRCRRVASLGEPSVSCSSCVRGDLTSWCSHFYRCETCDYNTCLQCAALQGDSEVPHSPPSTAAERGSPGEAQMVLFSPDSHRHSQSLDSSSRSPLCEPPPSNLEPLALPDVWVQL